MDIYQDEKDKRRKVITLSAAGESRLAEATDSINETISKILEVLDDEEIEIVNTEFIVIVKPWKETDNQTVY